MDGQCHKSFQYILLNLMKISEKSIMKKVIFCWSSCSLHGLRNDLPFSSERLKIEKFEKPLANLHDKTQYVIHIRNLKQALNYRSVLKKKPRIIKLNQ